MRTFSRNLMLSFVLAAVFPVASGTVVGAEAVRSNVISAPVCPNDTNWDAVLQRCR